MLTLETLREVFEVLMDADQYSLANEVAHELMERQELKDVILNHVEVHNE